MEIAVRRLPFVYPVYEAGYERALERLEAWADAQPRLLTFGRGGLFAHDNAHHALAEGWAAADVLGPTGASTGEHGPRQGGGSPSTSSRTDVGA